MRCRKSRDDRIFHTKSRMIRLIASPFLRALMAWIALIPFLLAVAGHPLCGVRGCLMT